jgi:prepilin peptidase CpaA
MIDLVLLIGFPLLLAFAASSDLLTMKISNRLSLALVFSFILAAFSIGLPLTQIGLHLATGICVLAITVAFFAAGWIGGGDAKLTAAVSVWLGFGIHLLEFILVASVFGAILTLGLLFSRSHPLPQCLIRRPWIARLHHPKTGIPYGIALSASALIIYPTSEIWRAGLI